MARALSFLVAIGLVVCSPASTSMGDPINGLEVLVAKCEAGGGSLLYDVDVDANKIGATSGQLTTPSGAYPLVYDASEGWEPGGTFNDDHGGLGWAELATQISSSWTLTWDAGQPTQTVCTISFPSIAEDDWFPLPVISYPVPADSPTPTNVTIQWSWAGNPTDPDLDDVFATVRDMSGLGLDYESPSLPTDATSWTPPELAEGAWMAGVTYGQVFARVPDGLTIDGDPWALPAGELWLYLDSNDRSEFIVMPDPVDGDANLDGAVDGGDYTLWADNYNQPGGWQQGDFTGDGFVDGGDYTLWADNYGYGTGSALIPEPATMLLLALGALALIRRRPK